MKSALILVDIQNDYFDGGKSELYLTDVAAKHAKTALEFFRKSSLPVYHIQHINTRPNATFFLPDSEGSKIHHSVYPLTEEKIFIKHAPNSFFDTGLADELLQKEIQHLVICGMMSHMCIDTTVRAAKDYGFTLTVLEDACTTKDLVWNGVTIPAQTVHNTIMASLNGTFANVIKTDDFILEFKNTLL